MTGTGALIRLILRRDRFVLPLWILLLAAIPLSYGSAMRELVPTVPEQVAYAHGIMASPAQLALLSPIFGTSIGALVAYRTGFIMVIVGLASLLTVIRHTRTEEEAGRRELIGSTVVGRRAPLAAALIVTLGADAVLGLITGAGLASTLPRAGAYALGLALTLSGWTFAAIGAIAAQLTEGARGARGIAVTALGAAYALRAAGDATGPGGSLSWLSWLSPIGWAQQLRPFAQERWWVLALATGFTAILSAAGLWLVGRRDVGAGLLPARPGPATAAAGLRSPLALAWRLHRGVLLGWAIGFALFGLVFGAVAADFGNQFGDNPQLRDLLARMGGTTSLLDSYFAACMSFIGLGASAYAVSAALRLRTEEEAQRCEPVLATAVSRLNWAGSHLFFVLLGPAVLLAVAGLATGLVHGADSGDLGHQTLRLLASAMVQLPAVWLLSGLTVAAFGLSPRLAVLGWVALAFVLFLGQVGAVLRFDQWALDLSPFTHLPKLPGGSVAVAPLAWLAAIAAALFAAGLAGFRRRDIG